MSKTVTVTQCSTVLPQTLKKQLRDDKTREVVAKALEDAIGNVVQHEALADIQNLNQRVKEIDDDFQKISGDLYKFDRQNFLDDKKRALRLHREWGKYHQRFKDILESSRKNANKARSVLKQYGAAVLTDFTAERIPDIKIELEGFMEEVDTMQEEALTSEQGFKKLAEDLRLFATIIEDALERRGVRFSVELQNARSHLAQLEKRLKIISTKMHSMGVACVSHLAVGAAAVAMTISMLSPSALSVAVKSIVGAAKTGNEYVHGWQERSVLKDKIGKCNDEIAALMAEQELFMKYRHPLSKTQMHIGTLADKIDAISTIWQRLKADMQTLHEEVKLVTKGKVITSRFTAKLQTARELYLDLAVLLEAYAKNFSGDKIHLGDRSHKDSFGDKERRSTGDQRSSHDRDRDREHRDRSRYRDGKDHTHREDSQRRRP